MTWSPEDGDETVFCNACMTELAFWYPAHRKGFYAAMPTVVAHEIIFYLESWAVASTIDDLQRKAVDYSKIVIYTDSMNTVDICNSLQCLPDFNPLLCFYIDICQSMNFDVHILHVPGEHNGVADAISHNNFEKAQKLVPGLNILKFKPPQFTMLGATKK